MTLDAHEHLPLVSIIIPFLNEERHLRRCLESVCAQTYPAERLEVMCVDGGSSDGSRAIVQEMRRLQPNLHLLDNPWRNAAGGLNVGLQHAHGEILLRVDAHALIAPDYVVTCVRRLSERPEIGNVGGPLRPLGETTVGRAIALALRSPFSMGGSPFRYARGPQLVDTVYLGAYRRRDLARVGRFNAALGANEDYEFNYRLRRAGFFILCDPSLQSHTYTRCSLIGLAGQYLRYGFWKAHVVRLHPRSLQWRHLAALAFLIAAGVALLAALAGQWLPLALLTAGYAGANLFAAYRAGWLRTGRPGVLLPLIFALMHLCWSAGLLAGLPVAIVKRK